MYVSLCISKSGNKEYSCVKTNNRCVMAKSSWHWRSVHSLGVIMLSLGTYLGS